MSKQTIKVKNSGGFWGFAKWLVILILVYIGLTMITGIFTPILNLFQPPKLDAQAETTELFNQKVDNGDITLITDEEKTDIKENMNSDTAIAIEDINTNMSVYDYRDIVVFVKNRDTKPSNVVFRKTKDGLVLEGMLLSYLSSNGTPSVQYYPKGANGYALYKNYNFQKYLILENYNINRSCFSFNDQVSQSVLFNQNLIDINIIKLIKNMTSNYTKAYNLVNSDCLDIIFKEFTSFNDKQHIMFDSMDEFSAFYSDVYQSIASLQKDCLVDYTNSEYVGLYEGTPGTETCKYYQGNSKFVVDYSINTKAYSVYSKDYAKGHVFDTDYSVVAYPKITFNLVFDESNTTLNILELPTHLFKNPLNVQAVLTNTETQETTTFRYDKNKSQYYAYLDYVTYQVDLTTEDELLQFDKQSFTFTVDKVVSKVDMKYFYFNNDVEEPDGPGGIEPVKGTFTLNYIFNREDINAMLEANSANIKGDSLILVSVKGYDSTDNLIHSFDLIIDKYLDSTEDSFVIPFARYVVEINCPILEFTIHEKTSNKTIIYEFELCSTNLIETIDLSFKWNGISSGFTMI